MVGTYNKFSDHKSDNISISNDPNEKNDKIRPDIPNFRNDKGHLETLLTIKVLKNKKYCKTLHGYQQKVKH